MSHLTVERIKTPRETNSGTNFVTVLQTAAEANTPLPKDCLSEAVVAFYVAQSGGLYKEKEDPASLERRFLGARNKDGIFHPGLKRLSARADREELAKAVFEACKALCGLKPADRDRFIVDLGDNGAFYKNYRDQLLKQVPELKNLLERPAAAGQN